MSIKDTIQKANREEEMKKNPVLGLLEVIKGIGDINSLLQKIFDRKVEPPVVNVDAPVVNVPAPIVNVPAPIVNVPAQERPIVKVEPPVVNVPAPIVNVEAPVVNMDLRQTEQLMAQMSLRLSEMTTMLSAVLLNFKPTDISGLEKEITAIKKMPRTIVQGGGGMGNVQHESKSVSSATTTVSTDYKISGGGFAIWAYYQGQMIVRGDTLYCWN